MTNMNCIRTFEKKYTRLTLLLLLVIGIGIAEAQPKFEKTNAAPGEFARIGFLPRGIALGNAMTSVINGHLSSFYNPAVAVFQESNSAQAGFAILSLDRSLNYLSFTRRFDFYSAKDTMPNRVPRSSAGFSAGAIFSGVSGIEERDNQGMKSGDLSTLEDLFFFSFANKFSKKVAVGVTVKIYYNKLYKDVTATGTGFDLGAVYRFNEQLTLAAAITDINAKYKWDTAPIYQTDGATTTNNFPVAFKFGGSYLLKFEDKTSLLAALDFESNNLGRRLLRGGVEYEFMPELFVRAGLDNFVLNNADELIQPSGGFSVRTMMFGMNTGLDYAFAIEQYSQSLRHTVALNVAF